MNWKWVSDPYRPSCPANVIKSGPQSADNGLQRNTGVHVTPFFHTDVRWSLFESDAITTKLMFFVANTLVLKHVLANGQMPQNFTTERPHAGFGPVVFLVVANTLCPSLVSSWAPPD